MCYGCQARFEEVAERLEQLGRSADAALVKSPARVARDPALERLEAARAEAHAAGRRRLAEEEARRYAVQKAEQARRDQRWREYRAIEVARCRQFEQQRRSAAGALCRNGDSCANAPWGDYCTWRHTGRDLPSHCRHFEEGNCRNGDRCWFNHLEKRLAVEAMWEEQEQAAEQERERQLERQRPVGSRGQAMQKPLEILIGNDGGDDDDDDGGDDASAGAACPVAKAALDVNVDKLKVAELREKCRELGLSTKGLKAELVARIKAQYA